MHPRALALFGLIGALPAADAHAETTADAVLLQGPEAEDWTPVYAPPGPLEVDAGTKAHPYVVTALEFRAPVFDKIQPGRKVIGRFWKGATAIARRARSRRVCNRGRGRWYALSTGGYVCDTYRFAVSRAGDDEVEAAPNPDTEARLPFRYGRVVEDGALRLRRLPEPDEVEQLEARDWDEDEAPDLVIEQMHGDFFLSLDRVVQGPEHRWYRTVHGEYVKADVVELREGSLMVGEKLEGADELPLAFTHQDEPQPVYCKADGDLERCGLAEKHARFHVEDTVVVDGERYVETPKGRLLPRDAVRIADTARRPRDVPADAKWVHFDLDQQTFVAYEGATPVYASLISAGKPGRDTPSGLYQVQRKYLTRTMRGPDAHGVYHVEDVPYTMYYRGPYAVHGAYWHDVFGNTRSHGCTNLAPADARWMYSWSEPEMPEGWHTRLYIDDGTWFYFTDE